MMLHYEKQEGEEVDLEVCAGTRATLEKGAIYTEGNEQEAGKKRKIGKGADDTEKGPRKMYTPVTKGNKEKNKTTTGKGGVIAGKNKTGVENKGKMIGKGKGKKGEGY